jgi:hypothetical protein
LGVGRARGPRVVKIFKFVEESQSSMTDVEDEHNRMARLLACVTGLVNQELLPPVVLGNSIYDRSATVPPVFRSNTPGSRGC